MTDTQAGRTLSVDRPEPDADAAPRVDGRRARRARNRVAVLDAVIELFSEDNLSPGVHEVAARAGVSLRSVYRYFEDLDSVVHAAIAREIDRVRPIFEIADLGEGPLDDRIARFARARVELFEAVRIVYVASCLRARLDPRVADGLTWARGRLAEQTRAMFAPELDEASPDDAGMLAVSLDVLCQLDTLERLRHELGFDVEETVDHVVDGLGRVLG